MDSKGDSHAHEKQPTDEHLRADAAAVEEPSLKPSGGQWRRAGGGDGEQRGQETTSEYPQRPGEPDCSYYLKFGRCGYATTCMFNHPLKPSGGQWRRAGGGDGEQRGQETTSEYPQRPGEPDCSYYLKFGRCGYATTCMFNHPLKPSGGQWRRAGGRDGEQQGQKTTSEYPQRPGEPDCSYYLKFGRCGYATTCMFNHPLKPSGGQWRRAGGRDGEQQGQKTTSEYPQRPGEPDCSYYLKFGRCGYATTCMFNHPPPRKLVCSPAGVWKCNHHHVEQVKLNSLGLPLRPGAGLCSHYMRKGICKFGTNCKFHHPDRSESEQAGSSQHNFFSRLGDITTPDPDLSGPLGPSPLELPTLFLLRHCSKEAPVQVYRCPEQSEGSQQLGDSHFEPAKPARYRYTRDQLLQLREAQQIVDVSKDTFELKQCVDMELHDEDHSWAHNDSNVNTRSYHRYDLADSREWRPRSSVQTPEVARQEKYSDNIHEAKESYGSGGKQEKFWEHDQLCCFRFGSKAQVIVDCEKFPYAAHKNEHFSNTILEDRQESSSSAPEISLVVNTTASKQCFCDASNIGKIYKDVQKKCDQEILRKSFTEESSSAKSKKNYMQEEFSHPVELSEFVCPSNSMASLQIDQWFASMLCWRRKSNCIRFPKQRPKKIPKRKLSASIL